VLEDLAWLGLAGEGEPLRQSTRSGAYQEALNRLREADLLYPCFCTRKDIETLAGAPQGPDGPRYPGTCRGLPAEEARARMEKGSPFAWRLKGDDLDDVVLARKDGVVAYHLAVVMDDAWQGVELVTRGRDLESATPMHRRLQELLGLPIPEYRHHGLVVDATGKRLAKRDDSRSLRLYRDQGMTPEEVIALAMESLETTWRP
jgi:glutamyl-Q tRNA(Asp) synthetase